MPVLLKESTETVHVNPELQNGKPYRIIGGYGAGRVFVVFQHSAGAKGVQYLGGRGGWDLATTVADSKFVETTLQEV